MTTTVLPKNKPFYDLQRYFKDEAQRLKLTKAQKTVTTGGKKEEKTIDNIGIQQDLSVFADSDINRPAWSDKYLVDSIFNEKDELVRLQYRPIAGDIKTRNIIIDFDKSTVAKVFIENSNISSIVKFNQILTYESASGYTIESLQEITFTNKQIFKVEVLFLN